MSKVHHLLSVVALLSLPTLSWGYAYTALTSNGILQNQSSGQPIVWNIPQQSFTLNFGSSLNAIAQKAIGEWNAVDTPLQFQTSSPGAQTCAVDGYNSAGFGSSTCSGEAFGDALAVTKRGYTKIGGTWYLSEADIVLDKSRNWQVYTGSLQNSIPDFHRVILHELGHALGLDHPDEAGQSVVAIMNSRTSDIDSLQNDDRNGIIKLYSNNTNSSSNSANQSAGSSGGGGGNGGGGSDALLGPLALLTLLLCRRRQTLI